MVINPFADNTDLWAGRVNSLANAPGGFAIKDGCTPTKGTGDWDVDVASGNVIVLGSGVVSVSAQTQDLTDPTSDMSSGQERIVIVTINSSGATNSVEGTAASDNPSTPSIPSDEVLVAVVHVSNSDATIADSDLYDSRTIGLGWNNETGSFAVGGNNNGTESVTFSNTYDSDWIVWGLSTDWDDNTPESGPGMWAHHDGWTTDANGDVTGMGVKWATGSLGTQSPAVYWNIHGVIVP